jgi:hypothetical protein
MPMGEKSSYSSVLPMLVWILLLQLVVAPSPASRTAAGRLRLRAAMALDQSIAWLLGKRDRG